MIAGQKVMDAAYLVTELQLPDPASTLNFGASGHSHRFIQWISVSWQNFFVGCLLNSEFFFCRIFCIGVECRIPESLMFKGIQSDVGVFEFLRLPCVQLWNETGTPAMGTGALVEIDELDWVWVFYNLHVKSVCRNEKHVKTSPECES